MITQLTAAVAFGAGVVSAASGTFPAGVAGTGTMGVTNPTAAVANTPLNQTSEARLLSLNSIDDFCFFAPPTPQVIADSETIEVAWCTKPRNNARLIPDGVLTGVRFLKTDFYVQLLAYGDFTKLNIPEGDQGGELDPHGAFGSGNPIGGNVTTNVTPSGDELNVGEWMQFISSNQVCLRACTNANSTYDAPSMCEHKLDEVGCLFVMPGDYNFNGTYASCDADVAYPPGWYPTATVDGQPQFSKFAQFFTGVFTNNGTPVSYTVGTTVTPSTAASTPSSSNCKTVSTISNGILSVSGGSTITGSTTASGGGSSGSSTAQTTGAQNTGGSGSGSNPSNTSAAGRVVPGYFPQAGALIGLTLASVITVAAGAIMVL